MSDLPAANNVNQPAVYSTDAAPDRAVESKVRRRKKNPNDPFVWGTGRRKTAVARVRIKEGEGKFIVNRKDFDQFFKNERDRQFVQKPLTVTDLNNSFDVFVNVRGGGTTGQAGAVALGLARALVAVNPDHLLVLREHRLLTRDPRKVERKKYGQSGARKRYQFSKR